MKRPSFQFYPADWKGNAKLRRCSEAARGAWMDILCILHDSDEYGVCRWPLADLARAAGVALKLAKELAEKLVLKGADQAGEPYTYTPTHAGKEGEAVTLVDPGAGPCWYSSRMVRDEWVRLRRGAATQFTAENQPPKCTPKVGIGERQGDGPSSTSSSASSNKKKEDTSLRSGVEEPPPVEIPDWIPRDKWDAFLAIRKQLKAKNTDHAKLLLIAALRKLRHAHDIGEVLDQSIMNSWKGVFPMKQSQPFGGEERKILKVA